MCVYGSGKTDLPTQRMDAESNSFQQFLGRPLSVWDVNGWLTRLLVGNIYRPMASLRRSSALPRYGQQNGFGDPASADGGEENQSTEVRSFLQRGDVNDDGYDDVGIVTSTQPH